MQLYNILRYSLSTRKESELIPKKKGVLNIGIGTFVPSRFVSRGTNKTYGAYTNQ